jgi:hypothetical protein
VGGVAARVYPGRHRTDPTRQTADSS